MYQPFIIELKNASLARHKDVVLPFANMNKAIAKVLIKEGFLETVREETTEGKKSLRVVLRYTRRKPTLTDVKIISKPSLRIYAGKNDLRTVSDRSSVLVLSTPQGVMTGKEARKKGVGGELLFKVW
jgi:small subunit ribosomal protein S8